MTAAQRRVIAYVAITTWFAITAVRSSGPLLSDLFDVGVTVAAGAGFGMFVLGGLIATVALPLARSFWWALPALAAGAVALRLVFPFLTESTLIVVGVLGTALALGLLLHAARVATTHAGGPGVAVGTALGAAVAVMEQVVLRTHDAVWRGDALGWAMIVVASAAVAGGAWWTRHDHRDVATRGWWAYGLVISVTLYALGNIAFVNSQAGVRMSWASAAVVAGLLAGAYLAADLPGTSHLVRVVLVAAAVPAGAVVMYAPGAGAFVALPVLAAGVMVALALAVRAGTGSQATLRLAGAATAWAVLALLPFMLIQLDYDIPLGFPHMLTMVVAIALVASAGVIRGPRPTMLLGISARRPASVAVAAVALVALPISVGTAVKYEGPGEYPADFIATPTVMSWNVHYGVTPGLAGGPSLNLEQVSATIAEVNPDVLMVQEVNRGWILAGGVDILEYLAGTYSSEFVYTPAHDHQFGNAIFANRPLSDAQAFQLPYGEGPQRRGVVTAEYMNVTYAVVHLQHKERDQTRVDQTQALLARLGGTTPLVVSGDFNDTPDSRTVTLMLDAGFVSAQDAFGVEGPTYIGVESNSRIDYVFGSGVEFTRFDLRSDVPWSDHLPLVVVLTTPGQ